MSGERINPGTQTISAPALAGGLTNGNITTSTGRPYSTSTMDVTALTYNAINRKLQLEATLDSVFSDVGQDVVFTGKKIAIPDACIMRLSSEKGARTQVLPLKNPLVGQAISGTDGELAGKERQATLEYMKVYYNEYCYGVIGETFGMNYNDLQIFQYYADEQPSLSRWIAEDEDRQYHEALLERFAYPLEATGTALTQTYNNNFFVPNTDVVSQPTYSATASTYRTNINTALKAAATGSYGVNANIDLDYLLGLDWYAQNVKKIKPVMVGGQKTYVVLLPSTQYHKLLQVNNGQLGSVWQNITQLSDLEQKFPGVVGRVKSLLIIEDQRYPTIKATNSYANNTHVVEYVNPGNSDSRNKSIYSESSNAAWDIGFLMGAGALIDWTVTPAHFEKNEGDYGKRYGKGVFVERGIQLGVYDTDTASNLNIKNFGSIVLPFTATSIVNIA